MDYNWAVSNIFSLIIMLLIIYLMIFCVCTSAASYTISKGAGKRRKTKNAKRK
tara:strand:+ start:460 stop:618 length:159 start_codon:yes stop_codon:yes gene_type:complete